MKKGNTEQKCVCHVKAVKEFLIDQMLSFQQKPTIERNKFQ